MTFSLPPARLPCWPHPSRALVPVQVSVDDPREKCRGQWGVCATDQVPSCTFVGLYEGCARLEWEHNQRIEKGRTAGGFPDVSQPLWELSVEAYALDKDHPSTGERVRGGLAGGALGCRVRGRCLRPP